MTMYPDPRVSILSLIKVRNTFPRVSNLALIVPTFLPHVPTFP